MLLYSPEYFMSLGQTIMARRPGDVSVTAEDRFHGMFGTSPAVCSTLWKMTHAKVASKPKCGSAEPKHLLWALAFMTIYEKESVMCTLVRGGHNGKACDEKTFRLWAWAFVEAIANLEDSVIVWENRKVGDRGFDCLVSVDGTDFQIQEPSPFTKDNYSHKFHGAGVRYEVALCILTGDIVSIHGPFQPGVWNDLDIFKSRLMHDLEADERVEADAGYRGAGVAYVKTQEPGQSPDDIMMREDLLARHEHVNGRLKNFGALRKIFRHKANLMKQHCMCFTAGCVITQLSFHHGNPLDQVEYWN